jgi:hypothetical protein
MQLLVNAHKYTHNHDYLSVNSLKTMSKYQN